jgi:LPS O-antigen subunit length determinant protein (WzzB/FepE family)
VQNISSDKPQGDEIDLKDLALTLWRAKKLIAACVAGAIFLASAYLWIAERTYTVRYTFMPVATEDNQNKFSGFGGLASLAGVSLPSGGTTDFKTFQMLLQSEEAASYLLNDEGLLKRIFPAEWDETAQAFLEPSASTLGMIKRGVKTALTGSKNPDYMAPNAARLADWLVEAFAQSEDRDTGFLTLSSQTPDPGLMLDVMTATTKIADKIIRDRFVERGQESVDFYQSKIASARSREHREALAQLIAQEEQKLMLASNGSYFVAQPLTTPSVSLRPTSPKASLVLALSIVLGAFTGAAVALIKKALSNV